MNQTAGIAVDDVYQQLFFHYYERLYTYAFSILKNEEDAKDTVQASFLKLWEKRHGVNLHKAGKSYLYTTVYRLSLNQIRGRKTSEAYQNSIKPEAALVPHDSDEGALYQKLVHCIETLPQRCREAFVKSRFEGKKYAQIAQEMDISIKTVEVQIGKALKLLRAQVADVFPLLILYILPF